MKKQSLSILVAIMLLALIFSTVFAGCNPTSEIDKFREKLFEAESLKMSMTTEVPYYGSVKITTYVDGNKTYMPAYLDTPSVFTETEGVVTRVYTDCGYYWKKETQYNTSGVEDDYYEELTQLFYGDNYEYSSDDKAFKKKSNVILKFEDMEFDSLLLTIVDNSCQLLGEVNVEGVLMECFIEITDINGIELVFDEIVTGEIVGA